MIYKVCKVRQHIGRQDKIIGSHNLYTILIKNMYLVYYSKSKLIMEQL